MPNKIRVKAVKFDDGVVEAYLPELEYKKSRRELLKEEREKKEPILIKEEAAPEKAEGEAPAEKEYEITPSAEGEVKIKKKKAPKKKAPKEKEPVEKEEKPEKEDKAKPNKKAPANKTKKKEGVSKKTSKKAASEEKPVSEETEKSK